MLMHAVIIITTNSGTSLKAPVPSFMELKYRAGQLRSKEEGRISLGSDFNDTPDNDPLNR